jgi:hypothetical protein
MEDFTFYKQPTRNIFKDMLPSQRAIQNILNYSKALQVKKTASLGLLVFFNN